MAGNANPDFSYMGSWRYADVSILDIPDDIAEAQGESEDHNTYQLYYGDPSEDVPEWESDDQTESSLTTSDTLWSGTSPTAYTGTSSYGSASVFAQNFQALPHPQQHHHQQALDTQVFHCEFDVCPVTFNAKDDWINHVITDHLGDQCPPLCSCLFCDKKFDSAKTTGGDRHANFVKRMEHIRKHVEKGKAWEKRHDDPELKDHPVTLSAGDPKRPTYYPPTFVPPKKAKKEESSSRQIIDQDKEDRRRKKESRKEKDSKKEHKKHSKR